MTGASAGLPPDVRGIERAGERRIYLTSKDESAAGVLFGAPRGGLARADETRLVGEHDRLDAAAEPKWSRP